MCSSVPYQYLSLYNILLIKTLNPRVKGATPPRVAPTGYFSLREGDFRVPGGLTYSALGHVPCTTENLRRGGRERAWCTSRAADPERREDGLRPTENAAHFSARARRTRRAAAGAETEFQRAGAKNSSTGRRRRDRISARGREELVDRPPAQRPDFGARARRTRRPAAGAETGFRRAGAKNSIEQPRQARPHFGQRAKPRGITTL